MKVQDFKELPLDEKISCLWDKGLAIHQERMSEKNVFCIFEIEDFYVEAIFSKHKIVSIRIMEEVTKWESYVDFNLRALLNAS